MEKTMDMDVQKIKKQIELLANNLQSLMELVVETLPDMPEEAKRRLSEKRCLKCGKPLNPEKRTLRGNHENCYRIVFNSIKRGDMTEFEAMAQGLFSHPDTGGRPIDSDIQETLEKMKKEIKSGEKKPVARKKTTKTAKAPRKAKGSKQSGLLHNPNGE